MGQTALKWTIGNLDRVEERVREEDGQAAQREEREEEEEGRSDNTPTAHSLQQKPSQTQRATRATPTPSQRLRSAERNQREPAEASGVLCWPPPLPAGRLHCEAGWLAVGEGGGRASLSLEPRPRPQPVTAAVARPGHQAHRAGRRDDSLRRLCAATPSFPKYLRLEVSAKASVTETGSE